MSSSRLLWYDKGTRGRRLTDDDVSPLSFTPFPLERHARHKQTSLASRALDGLSDPKIKQGVIDELFRYLDTDTTWYVVLPPPAHPPVHTLLSQVIGE
jgi:hypothetical protein